MPDTPFREKEREKMHRQSPVALHHNALLCCYTRSYVRMYTYSICVGGIDGERVDPDPLTSSGRFNRGSSLVSDSNIEVTSKKLSIIINHIINVLQLQTNYTV